MSDSSRLVQNILQFSRTLRDAGLRLGTGQVIDAVHAVARAGIERRDDFYWALRSVLVTDPSQFRIFDQAFHLYFRNPRLLERIMSLLLPTVERDHDGDAGDPAARRLLEALADTGCESLDDANPEFDRSASYSHREMLREKDFEQMSLEEQAEARQILQQDFLHLRPVNTRRFRPQPRGNRYDLRRSMRLMLRNNGQLIELARKRRRTRLPELVLICDISGSMSQYSRMFLLFAHALCTRQQAVHTFVFGTRLTNISHRLLHRDVDKALVQVSSDVRDWDGGTRIGECLQRFNVEWSRRVLARQSVVVLLSDGLERDTGTDLEFEMQRLRRSCQRLIWMNPLLRFDGFEPKASGVRKMLPHVDRLVSAHNVMSLLDLAALLDEPADAFVSPAVVAA